MLLGLAKSELCRRKASRNEVASVTIAREVTPTPAAPPTAEGGSEGASTMEATVQPAMQVSAQPARSRPALRKQSCSLSTDAFALVLAKKTNEGSATQGISGTIERGAAFFSPHLSSTRRHNIGVLLRSNQFRTHSTAFALTGTEIMAEMRTLSGFQERLILKTVTKEGRGDNTWMPVFRVTADKLDKHSRTFFPLACECAVSKPSYSRLKLDTSSRLSSPGSVCLSACFTRFATPLNVRFTPVCCHRRHSACYLLQRNSCRAGGRPVYPRRVRRPEPSYGDGQRTPGHWPPPRRQHAKQSFASA